MKGRIFALAAALLILLDASRVCHAAPPSDSPWKMTFSGEFQRRDLTLQKWTAKSRSSDRPPSEVLRDNIEINNGACRLLTGKGKDGKSWTTAQFFSTDFKQRYGYFETRMKVSGTPGLTNVLALIGRDKATGRMRFYVDVVHAYYPDTYITRVGMPAGPKNYPDQKHATAVDLSKDYHLYGLQWTDSELIWYFDGREVRRLSHTLLRQPARVQLVTWVSGFSGEAPGALEAATMEVDYVRVYRKLDRTPNWSQWQDGIQ